MKTIKIIIISLLVGLNLTSCDFLEKDPTYTTPENFFKNEADATSWLTGTYAILGQSSSQPSCPALPFRTVPG